MTERKVVLVHPNSEGNYVQGAIQRENLGLGYLSAEMKTQGLGAEIVDFRITGQTSEEAAKDILDKSPLIVGFSIIAKDACNWVERVSQLVKTEKPQTHIAAGNYFPTMQPHRALQVMPNVDSVVIREGDVTLPELALCLATGSNWRQIQGLAYRADAENVIINPLRPLVKDLDKLPFPDHYASRFQLDEFAIEGSRGCHCRCTFCSIPAFMRAESPQLKWRDRSPESIGREIKENHQRHPDIRLFRFVDPDFVGAQKHADRLHDFVRQLRDPSVDIEFIFATRTKVVNSVSKELWKDMKDVGLKEVYVGVETASPHIKRMMKKGTSIEEDRRAIDMLHDLGIRVRYGFMMITPWTKEEDIEINARALRSLIFPRLEKYFQEMFLIPGTDAVNLVQKTADIWWDQGGDGEYYSYDLPHPIYNLRKLTRFVTTKHLEFLNRFQKLHERVRFSQSDQIPDSGQIIERLNDFSLNFFLALFEVAKKLTPDAPMQDVSGHVSELIRMHEQELVTIESEI